MTWIRKIKQFFKDNLAYIKEQKEAEARRRKAMRFSQDEG